MEDYFAELDEQLEGMLDAEGDPNAEARGVVARHLETVRYFSMFLGIVTGWSMSQLLGIQNGDFGRLQILVGEKKSPLFAV